MKPTTKTSRTAAYIEKMVRALNEHYFGGELEEPIVTKTTTTATPVLRTALARSAAAPGRSSVPCVDSPFGLPGTLISNAGTVTCRWCRYKRKKESAISGVGERLLKLHFCDIERRRAGLRLCAHGLWAP